MEKNQQTATAHRFIAVMWAAFFLFFMLNVGAMSSSGMGSGVGAILLLVPGAAFVSFHLYLASAVESELSWARTASLTVGLFMLLIFPIGTVFGAWLVATTWKPWPLKKKPDYNASELANAWPKTKEDKNA